MDRVVLIGLSGTGKSSLAPLVARELGFSWLDTDQEIVKRFGRSIPEVFRTFGESAFRAVEREVIWSACDRQGCVIATGGGAVLDEANWAQMRPGTVIIHLRASGSEIVRRLQIAEADNSEDVRPLLAEGNPEERLAELWSRRQPLYDRADIEVQTDGKTLAQVADEIVEAVRRIADTGLVPITSIDVPGGRSDIYAGAGVSAYATPLITSRWRNTQRVWIITDLNVQEHWGGTISRQFQDAGFHTELYAIEPGESSKTLRVVEDVLDWMISGKVQRGDVVVAVGGASSATSPGLWRRSFCVA